MRMHSRVCSLLLNAYAPTFLNYGPLTHWGSKMGIEVEQITLQLLSITLHQQGTEKGKRTHISKKPTFLNYGPLTHWGSKMGIEVEQNTLQLLSITLHQQGTEKGKRILNAYVHYF